MIYQDGLYYVVSAAAISPRRPPDMCTVRFLSVRLEFQQQRLLNRE